MSLRTHLILFLSGLILPAVLAQFQPIPGYLDSDYYYAGGLQLVTGKGFTQPYLWNYLDEPQSLPHPSHNYWMPLASIVAALGMWLTGQATYAAARIPFILIAACIPPLTAAFAWKFTQRRDLAITSALLAIFSVYHSPFVGVTDNFGLFMLFGGLYFLVLTQLISAPLLSRNWLFLGLISGLMTLSRSDGLLWLGLTLLLVLFYASRSTYHLPRTTHHATRKLQLVTRNSLLVLLGFLLVISPWYARNLNLYGSIMAPGGSRALWLDDYDQTFTFPASNLTMQSWLSLGWHEILTDRRWALEQNLQSGFAAHGGIILFPFILVGIVKYWSDVRVRLGVTAWLILFAVMTLLFPFAGARGAFFHAGASLQPLWWTLAPLGLESVIASARKRGWFDDHAQVVFRSVLLLVTIILTGYVAWLRIFSLGWGENEGYAEVETFLQQQGIQQDDVVIIRNPVGYYTTTGRAAIVIPYADEQGLLALSEQFDARYLVIEPEAAMPPIKDLFDNPHSREHFDYLGELDGAQIYEIVE